MDIFRYLELDTWHWEGFKNSMKFVLKNTLTALAKRQDLVGTSPVLPGGIWSRSEQSHDRLDNSQSHNSTAEVRV